MNFSATLYLRFYTVYDVNTGFREYIQLFNLIFFNSPNSKRFSRWLSGKESACQCRRCKRHRCNPWVGKWLPTPVFLPANFHGQWSLAGHNPWDHKESDMTEQLSIMNNSKNFWNIVLLVLISFFSSGYSGWVCLGTEVSLSNSLGVECSHVLVLEC